MKDLLDMLAEIAEYLELMIPAIYSIGAIFGQNVNQELEIPPNSEQLALLSLAKIHVELSAMQQNILSKVNPGPQGGGSITH